MYTFLILFFLSLFGIIFMIGRKLKLINNGNIQVSEDKTIVNIPDLHELKHSIKKNTGRFSFIALVIVLRGYVLTEHFIKSSYKKIITKINKTVHKYIHHKKFDEQAAKEPSKFLKMVSEYKHKVKKIKHQIKEEEGIK